VARWRTAGTTPSPSRSVRCSALPGSREGAESVVDRAKACARAAARGRMRSRCDRGGQVAEEIERLLSDPADRYRRDQPLVAGVEWGLARADAPCLRRWARASVLRVMFEESGLQTTRTSVGGNRPLGPHGDTDAPVFSILSGRERVESREHENMKGTTILVRCWPGCRRA